MKKTIITLAAIATTGAVLAQSAATPAAPTPVMGLPSITISGSVAAAYEQYSVGGDAALTGFDASANNITIKGVEDMGGGLKGSFTLQKRFNLVDGTAYNNKEFENAFVTVSGGFGSLSVGRHQAISVAAFDVYEGLGVRVWNAPIVGNGGDYGYNNTSASRYDTAISYTTPSFGGFDATLVTTKNPSVNTARESTAVRLGYASGPLVVHYVWENVAAKTGDVQRADQNLGVIYDFKVAKAMMLWGAEGSADSRTSVGVIVPVGKYSLKAQYRNEGKTVSATGVKSVVPSAVSLGVEYSLSDRTTLFAHYGDYDKAPQDAYRLGIKRTF